MTYGDSTDANLLRSQQGRQHALGNEETATSVCCLTGGRWAQSHKPGIRPGESFKVIQGKYLSDTDNFGMTLTVIGEDDGQRQYWTKRQEEGER